MRNAQFTLQQNRAAVAAAKAGVDSARQSLYAEQRSCKWMSTLALVLQNESMTASAQSNLISAMAAYEKSRLELDRSTGLLLEHFNIQIADAQRGRVTQEPNVPDIAPMQNCPDNKLRRSNTSLPALSMGSIMIRLAPLVSPMATDLEVAVRKVASIDPATGELLRKIDCTSESAVQLAVSRAHSAQTQWPLSTSAPGQTFCIAFNAPFTPRK